MGPRSLLNRLNGWRRLWLVLMGLSLLGLIPYVLSLAARSTLSFDLEVWSGFRLPECRYILSMAAGTESERRPRYDSPCYALYSYRSIYKNAATTEEGYTAHITQEQNKYAREAFGWLLLVWAILGGLVYAAGAVVAWIVRGCRASPT